MKSLDLEGDDLVALQGALVRAVTSKRRRLVQLTIPLKRRPELTRRGLRAWWDLLSDTSIRSLHIYEFVTWRCPSTHARIAGRAARRLVRRLPRIEGVHRGSWIALALPRQKHSLVHEWFDPQFVVVFSDPRSTGDIEISMKVHDVEADALVPLAAWLGHHIAGFHAHGRLILAGTVVPPGGMSAS